MEGEEHVGSNQWFVLMPGMSPSWLLQLWAAIPSSSFCMQAEVDYGSPELPESDRGHVTCEPPSKDASDLHDWEMLSRNPSPSPERCESTPLW